jgi:hypothetical protein
MAARRVASSVAKRRFGTLQQISPSPVFHGPQDLDIAGIRGQHDDASFGKLAANREHRIQTVHLRHLQVHQRDVRAVRTELLNRFSPVRRLRNQTHIRLSGHQRGDPVSK